jgi:hypothetical protein
MKEGLSGANVPDITNKRMVASVVFSVPILTVIERGSASNVERTTKERKNE